MRKFECALALLLAFTAAAGAQSAEQAKKQDEAKNTQAAEASQTQAAKPAPEMQKITRMFAGRWQTETKMAPSEFAPQGGTSKGMSIMRRGPGRLSLVEDMRSTGAMGRFVGHGIIWWDSKQGAYKGLFCDNWSPNGCEMTGMGNWDGDKLVFAGETEAMGQKMSYRETYSDITADSFTFTMDSASGGGELKPILTIKYLRVKNEAGKKAEGAAPSAQKQ